MVVKSKAFSEGYSAFTDDVSKCPYNIEESPEEYVSWGEGWVEACTEYFKGM